MKTFMFCMGFVMLDAIVPRSCQNGHRRPDYYEDDSLYYNEDTLDVDSQDTLEITTDSLSVSE